jgi:hypothetical protein
MKPSTTALRHAAFGGLAVAAVSLWSSSWLAGLAIVTHRGWLYSGLGIPAEHLPPLLLTHDEILGQLREVLHLPLPTHPVGLPLVATALGFAVGFALTLAAVLLRVDRTGESVRALPWTLRALLSRRSLVAWAIAFLLFPLFLVLVLGRADSLIAVIAAIVYSALSTTVIPFLACRSAVSAGQRAWWSPAWPGLSTILAVLGLAAGLVLLNWLEDLLFGGLPALLDGAGGLAVLLVSWQVSLAQATILQSEDARGGLRSLFRPSWTTFGPWVAWHAIGGLLSSLAIGPLAAGHRFQWKIVPVLVTTLEGLDLRLPAHWQLGLAAASSLGRCWWLLIPGISSLFFWLGGGRVVHAISDSTHDHPDRVRP